MRDHYWDLNECRWVHYVRDQAEDVLPVPVQRSEEQVADAASARAVVSG